MAKYLVIFNDQINDVEITGFKAMTDKEVEYLESIAQSIKWSFDYPLTNYSLEFADGDDYLSRLDFKEISNEEYKAINKTFNEGFGIFIHVEHLEGLVEDEEEELLDDEEDGYYDDNDEGEFEDEDY